MKHFDAIIIGTGQAGPSLAAVHVARRGAEYGFCTGDMRVDMKQVKARKDAASASCYRYQQARSSDRRPITRTSAVSRLSQCYLVPPATIAQHFKS